MEGEEGTGEQGNKETGRRGDGAMRRRRGAQPGNLNALKHGLYARNARPDPAAAQALNGEIAMTRVAARRMLELFEAEKTVKGKIALAKVISKAAVHVASLLKRKKYLNGGGDSPGAALEEALKSVAAETEEGEEGSRKRETGRQGDRESGGQGERERRRQVDRERGARRL